MINTHSPARRPWRACNNGVRIRIRPSSLLNIPRQGQGVSVTITGRMAAWRQDWRAVAAAWRLGQTGAGTQLGASLGRAEEVSIRH